MDASLYAIYVTAGPSAHDSTYEWGGYHITITGFQLKHEEKVNKLVNKIASKYFSKESNWKLTDYEIQKWKGRWTVVIKSTTLLAIAEQFHKSGFIKIKGPIHSSAKFHITLPSTIKTSEDAHHYANTLRENDWFITIVKNKAGTKNCKWCKYFPLKE